MWIFNSSTNHHPWVSVIVRSLWFTQMIFGSGLIFCFGCLSWYHLPCICNCMVCPTFIVFQPSCVFFENVFKLSYRFIRAFHLGFPLGLHWRFLGGQGRVSLRNHVRVSYQDLQTFLLGNRDKKPTRVLGIIWGFHVRFLEGFHIMYHLRIFKASRTFPSPETQTVPRDCPSVRFRFSLLLFQSATGNDVNTHPSSCFQHCARGKKTAPWAEKQDTA